MRLGVYSDLRYRYDDDGLSTNRSFIRFVTNLPPRTSELVIFGRLNPEPGRMPYPLALTGVRFVALPWYPSVTALGGVIRALWRSTATFGRELEYLDAVWLFGPHPLALVFALVALARRTPVFLGVRQDYPKYIGGRLPSRRWMWAVPVAHALDGAFRLLARRAPTVALGAELARKYGRGAPVLTTGFSLVRRAELVALEEALAKPWNGDELRLLSVGRLDPEKNPLLLLEVIRGLRVRDPRWRLTIAGEGPLREELQRRVGQLGLEEAVTLVGEVPNGPLLWDLYRRSHLFLHISFTEGLPQVLYEAQAAGLPIVATAVGGVAEALRGGELGVLIHPNDAGEAIVGVDRIMHDEELRRRLIMVGRENAEHETLEAQLDRTAAFFQRALDTRSRGRALPGAQALPRARRLIRDRMPGDGAHGPGEAEE